MPKRSPQIVCLKPLILQNNNMHGITIVSQYIPKTVFSYETIINSDLKDVCTRDKQGSTTTFLYLLLIHDI